MKTRTALVLTTSLFATCVIGSHMQPAYAAPLITPASVEHSTTPVLIIRDSGATNLDGYHATGRTVTFTGNGSASLVTPDGADQVLPHASFNSSLKSVITLIDRAGGPQNIRTTTCLRSMSFGRSVWVSMEGKTSGNLMCVASDARAIDRKATQGVLALENLVFRRSVEQGVL